MDIAALSIGLNQANIRQDASLSVMKKVMDQADTKSNEMIKMMQQSVQPHIGSSIDIKG